MGLITTTPNVTSRGIKIILIHWWYFYNYLKPFVWAWRCRELNPGPLDLKSDVLPPEQTVLTMSNTHIHHHKLNKCLGGTFVYKVWGATNQYCFSILLTYFPLYLFLVSLPVMYYNFTIFSSRYYCYIRWFSTNFPRVFINSHHICAVLAYKVKIWGLLHCLLCILDSLDDWF